MNKKVSQSNFVLSNNNKENLKFNGIDSLRHTVNFKQSPTIIDDYFNPSKVLKDYNR